MSATHPHPAPLLRTLLAAALAAGMAGANAKTPADPQLPGEILLQLHATSALGPLLAKYKLAELDQFGARPMYRVKLVGKGSVKSVIASLELEPDVIVAEPNTQHSSPEARKNVVAAIGTPEQYVDQWAPAAIDLPQALQITRGAGMRVAVLDTGVDFTHPALAGHLLPGIDFVDMDNDPSERGSVADLGYGHGTHVSGIVALAAPDARIVPYRVLDPSGRGNVWVLGQAMLRAVDPDGNPATDDGAHVINASLGTLTRTRMVESVMKLAGCNLVAVPPEGVDFTDPGYDVDRTRCVQSRGAVIVAAAGNGASKSEKQYPAAENEYGLIAVAATASNGRLARFSNFGGWISIAGPGEGITSTVPGNAYGTWGGTSMAAPFVAGTAALVRARYPAMSPKDVARRLEDTATTICGADLRQVDADAALTGRAGAASRPCQ